MCTFSSRSFFSRGHGTSDVAAVEPLRLPPVSALCLLGLSSVSLDRPPAPPPPSLPVCGPMFSPWVSSLALLPPAFTALFLCLLTRLLPPTTGSVVPLLLAQCLPFLASSLCSSVFASLVLRHPLFSFSCVLSSLVTDPTAPPPIFALVAAVANFASIRCLEYAYKLVYEGKREIQ
ncbi:unnamed protein product [Closterium sp. NIES-65]|nr:unnamed protein product [Closterium sp. NIES-65]